MGTRSAAAASVRRARQLARSFGAHVVDAGIMKDGTDWIIEVGISRMIPEIQEMPQNIGNVKVKIVSYDSPTRDDRRIKILNSLRNKGLIR